MMKKYSNWKLIERKANDNGYKGTKSISKNDAKELVKNLDFFNVKDKSLYRGIDLPEDFYIIDPKQDRREYVVGTMPTLIMEYQESWKDYPSRMESLFMTNVYDDMYGKVFHVIPLDKNAKFGLSPNYNYKDSFTNIEKIGMTANNFFYGLADYFNYTGNGVFTIPNTPEEKKNYIIKENYDYTLLQINEMLLNNDCKSNVFCNFSDAEELIDYYFNAEKNGFKNINYNELMKSIDFNAKEIWTDSKCLLIAEKKYRDIFNI